MKAILHKFQYNYFPYETRLSIKEVTNICTVLKNNKDCIIVEFPKGTKQKAIESKLSKLTYFKGFEFNGTGIRYTDQYLFETLANGLKPGQRKQSTRYSVHGLHEYKGKFNPQIVKYLINSSNLPKNSIIFDPFCGSGTTLVESLHLGINSVGIDANPLSVALSKAKPFLLKADKNNLEDFERRFRKIITKVDDDNHSVEQYAGRLGLTEESLSYLFSWFPKEILKKFLRLRFAIKNEFQEEWNLAADILISSIVRKVSYQDPADLRIRRRKTKLNINSVDEMLISALDSLMHRCKNSIELLPESRKYTVSEIYLGDCRDSLSIIKPTLKDINKKNVDIIVTSPPYATALPYIETDRLSLILLGLAQPSHLRKIQALQIGDREILESTRRKDEENLEHILSGLPSEILKFILKLNRATKESNSGFRRRNLPVLLARYFSSINEVLKETLPMLSENGIAYWIVGRNKTTVNNRDWIINTPRWIAKMAELNGAHVEINDLETYQRYGLHHNNSIRHEVLLSMETP